MSEPQQPGQNPYQPSQHYQGYGPGGVPWGPPPDHPQATTILVLGILGLALCQVMGPIAWVMGNKARKEIAASNGTIGGQTQVTVGWALGIAASIMLIVGVLFFVVYIIGLVVFVGTSGSA